MLSEEIYPLWISSLGRQTRKLFTREPPHAGTGTADADRATRRQSFEELRP